MATPDKSFHQDLQQPFQHFTAAARYFFPQTESLLQLQIFDILVATFNKFQLTAYGV
jgi:hypothetical protein